MKKLVRNIVLGLFSIFVFQSCLSNYGGVSTYDDYPSIDVIVSSGHPYYYDRYLFYYYNDWYYYPFVYNNRWFVRRFDRPVNPTIIWSRPIPQPNLRRIERKPVPNPNNNNRQQNIGNRTFGNLNNRSNIGNRTFGNNSNQIHSFPNGVQNRGHFGNGRR